MTTTTLVCATPKNGTSAPKGKPESKKTVAQKARTAKKSKLPVPPPTPEQQAASAADAGDIPASLDRTNGRTNEEIDAERNKLVADAQVRKFAVGWTGKKEAAKIKRTEQQKTKTAEKRAVKKEHKTAVESGATKAMPLAGKDAEKALKKAAKANSKAAAKPTAKGKPKNGKPAKKGGNKRAQVLEMLKGKGATREQICSKMGWVGVSVPQLVRGTGLKLIKDKDDGVIRYRVA